MDDQISHAATRGRGALYVWLRALRSPWLPAAAKAILHMHIAPCMWFGMDLWRATGKNTAIDRVMMHAAWAIAVTCASPAALAYVRQRSVRPGVLLSDLGILPARDMCRLAHARHRVRTHQADARARSDRTGDSMLALDCFRAMPAAAAALDYMGAAVRSAPSGWLKAADGALYRLRVCAGVRA